MHTTAELAKLYGVPVSTIDSWIRTNKINAIRLPSGRYRISEKEYDKAVRESGVVNG